MSDTLSLVRAERGTVHDSIRGSPAARGRGRNRWSLQGARRRRSRSSSPNPGAGTVRAVAAGCDRPPAAQPGRGAASEGEIEARRAPLGGGAVRPTGTFWLAVPAAKVVVLDTFRRSSGRSSASLPTIPTTSPRWSTSSSKLHRPVTLKPSVSVINGSHLMELSSGDIRRFAEAVIDASRNQTFIVGQEAEPSRLPRQGRRRDAALATVIALLVDSLSDG